MRDKNPWVRVPLLHSCVELTGVEPVSKQGTPVLSTRLSWPSFSSGSKTQATNHRLICLNFSVASQPAKPIPCISAPLYPFSPQTWLGAMSRSSALRPNKPIYYTSIRQREHKKCCQLYFEARLTGVASLPGVLTQLFYLLSKPSSPFSVSRNGKSAAKLQNYLHISKFFCTFVRFFTILTQNGSRNT